MEEYVLDKSAFAECLALTDRYDAILNELRAAGADSPAELAAGLVERLGNRRPDYLFLPLYTITEHLK